MNYEALTPEVKAQLQALADEIGVPVGYITIAVTIVLGLFTACGGSLNKPKNGTYTSQGLISQTWTFSGSNKITLSTLGGMVSTSGTYTISGDTLKITASVFGSESTTSYTITEITSRSFLIDGDLFEKQY